MCLRNLASRYVKRPRSELVIQEITKAQQMMSTETFRASIKRYMKEDEPLILEKEIRFSKLEAAERST